MPISEIEEIQEEPTFNRIPRRHRSPEIQELPPVTGTPKTLSSPNPPKPSRSCWSGIFSSKRQEKEPVAEKSELVAYKCVGRTRGLAWASKFSIGSRPAMEDFHTTLRGFTKMTCGEFGGCTAPHSHYSRTPVPVHYFGVFDGHRGEQVSEFCANRLHHMLIEEWNKPHCDEEVEWRERWKIAFSKAFERADDIVKQRSLEIHYAGSTASVVILSPCQIIASNCGDSRTILCRGEDVIPLTVDHKPTKKGEAKRVKRSGGEIYNRRGLRVDGVLSLTRAIGDHDLKSYVISTPDVTYTRRSKDDLCLIMASDGLWDVMSNEKVAKIARKKLLHYRSCYTSSTSPAPTAVVAQELARKALAKSSKDNITVIVIDLKPLSKRKQSSRNNEQARASGGSTPQGLGSTPQGS